MGKVSKVFLTVFIFLVVISGCAVAPTIELSKIIKTSDSRDQYIDTFFLRKSVIKIEKSELVENNVANASLSITSVPVEHTDFKIGVKRADTFGVKTNLNFIKSQNTELVEEAGVEVLDKRVEYINKLGTIVTKLMPGIKKDFEPMRIDINTVIKNESIGREAKDNVKIKDSDVLISFGPVPPDAKSINDFSSPMTLKGLIFSACRQATIRTKYNDAVYEKTVKINDPNYYQIVSFPEKGKISFHCECGVSVKSDKDSGISTNSDLIEALATQGKVIIDAIDASKKDK